MIQEENAKRGTRKWLLNTTSTVPGVPPGGRRPSGRSVGIEGYCSSTSVRAGETLQIMVSTNPPSKFKLQIFRTGYYNGDGGRLMKTLRSIQGITQPDPPVGTNYLQECQWEPTLELEIPSNWLSGVYLGKLTAKTSDQQSYIIFVVRDDAHFELDMLARFESRHAILDCLGLCTILCLQGVWIRNRHLLGEDELTLRWPRFLIGHLVPAPTHLALYLLLRWFP